MTFVEHLVGDIARHVDERRLWDRHMSLARHGAMSNGGVCRLALSAEEIAARGELLAVARDLDMTVTTDAIGNLFFLMEGSAPELAPVMTGSHIDSQPVGGKFDGTFGVLAGFETVAAFRAAGFTPRRPVVVVAWMNEEGSRFAPGMMGSEAFTGRRALSEMMPIKDAEGISVGDALADMAAAFPEVPARPLGFPVHAFIEAHIEQGPVLEREGKPVGIVTGMQGSRRFRITVTGEEAHAGTEPLLQRRDALMAAIDIIGALRVAFHDPEDIVKFTVGKFDVSPNAPSVVPGRVFFSIDLRHPEWSGLKRLGDLVVPLAEKGRGGCSVEVREIATAESIVFPEHLTGLLGDIASQLGESSISINSLAGHDARQLHFHCSTAMLFVPCAGGISHNEAESCTASDLASGTRVLAEAVACLAR